VRFGDKVVGDAARSEEGPQWPENLGKKMGQNEHHNTELGQAIVRAHMASTIEKVELTGDVWRPKNTMDEGVDVPCYYYYFYVEWGVLRKRRGSVR